MTSILLQRGDEDTGKNREDYGKTLEEGNHPSASQGARSQKKTNSANTLVSDF